MQRVGAKWDHCNGGQREGQCQQRRKIVDELVDAGGGGIFLEKELQPIRQRLQQPVWPDAMRSPARLNVRDNFALEPGEIRVNGQNHKQQDGDLYECDQDFRVLGDEVVHDLASASCKDFIMVQKRVRVPV